MACLEELQDNVAAILALLQTRESCCDPNTTHGEDTEHETEIDPGVGDPPDYYGETSVADWDEWLEYLCHTAHIWVDELVSNALTMEISLSIGGLTLAILAYIFGAFNFLFMRGDLNVSTLALRLVNLVAGYSISMFSDAGDDIEAARDMIVCRILNGGDVSDAIETALASGDAWDLVYSHIDYDSAVAILYEGGDGENYLPAVKRTDCECGAVSGSVYALSFEMFGFMEMPLRSLRIRPNPDSEGWHHDPNWPGDQIDPFTAPQIWAHGDATAEGDLDPAPDVWITLAASKFRPTGNEIMLRAQKWTSANYALGFTITKIRAWVSEDAGVSGVWRDCELTEQSAGTYWTVVNDTLVYSYPSGTDTFADDLTISFAMYPA